MPTHLKQGATLRRTVSVPGLSEAVIVALTTEGMYVRAAGSRVALFHNWVAIISALRTPGNIPSFLADRPMDLLRHYQHKSKRRIQKGD